MPGPAGRCHPRHGIRASGASYRPGQAVTGNSAGQQQNHRHDDEIVGFYRNIFACERAGRIGERFGAYLAGNSSSAGVPADEICAFEMADKALATSSWKAGKASGIDCLLLE
ncbi:hypothetical protein [Actinoplanes sp. URMC 104]|uniref:hypothetical protein n=1 Tax=Actinoplanes sp. URMC 104 TaxID=3423409 RepID=UPI003F1E0005